MIPSDQPAGGPGRPAAAGPAADAWLELLAAVLATDTRGSIVFSAKGGVLLANAAVGAAVVAGAHGFGASADWAAARDRARLAGNVPVEIAAGVTGTLSHVAPDEAAFDCYVLRLDEDAAGTGPASRVERIAFMAHDLRAPLQSLIIAADALGEERDADGRTAEIGALAGLALDQIRNLLETARMDEVSAHVEPVETFELAGLVRDMARLLEPICRRSGNHIALDLPRGEFWQTGAAHLIRAVLQNLIANANRFNMNGPVTVRLRLDPADGDAERLVQIEVEDVGPGLSEAERDLLLRPRRAVAPRATATGGGYGLGLGIVSRAVARLRGKIEVGPGAERGTRFRISFPLANASGPAEAAAPDRTVSLSGLRVLVVEDNPVNLAILLRTLVDAGAEAEGVVNGHDALARMRENRGRIDIVLLDVTLPDIDGIEVARRIREEEAGGDPVLIVGLTAHVGAVVHGSGLAAGMNHILIKPVRPSELRLALREAWEGEHPSQAMAKKNRSPEMMLDNALVAELAEEMSREAAVNFMRQALAEARSVLEAFRAGGDDLQIRHKIHSAIGSAGLTGLAGVQYGMQRLQTDARAGLRSAAAAEETAEIIRNTEIQIEAFARGE